MTLIHAVRKVMKNRGFGLDKFEESDWLLVKKLSKDPRNWKEIKRVSLNRRKKGEIGSVLGGVGPIKVADVVCPHCGKRHG